MSEEFSRHEDNAGEDFARLPLSCAGKASNRREMQSWRVTTVTTTPRLWLDGNPDGFVMKKSGSGHAELRFTKSSRLSVRGLSGTVMAPVISGRE